MKYLIIILAITLTAFCNAETASNLAIKFHGDKNSFAEKESIHFQLVLDAGSNSESNKYEKLIIDDYRYDEPNYFSDKRVPNLTFHLEKKEKNSWSSHPYRLSSQGGGLMLEKLSIHVHLHFLLPDYVSLKEAHDFTGEYRLRATFHGIYKGKRTLLSTKLTKFNITKPAQ
jgi:hypothetical protein